MARTANVFARVEPEIKEEAEHILDCLGIPMSNAVGMFLRQVVLQKGIPFDVKLPVNDSILMMDSLSREQLYAELEKSMEDIRAGRVHTIDEVEAEIRRELINEIPDLLYGFRKAGHKKHLQIYL